MNSVFIARMTAVLLLCASATPGSAQVDPANVPVKEVQIAATSFFLADPVPAWVEPAAIPEGNKKAPLVVRLADTQLLVTDTPIEHVHRAVMINDAASLTAAGQLTIAFVPDYQRLHLHAVRVLRGHETLDRTLSSTVRFLQRETGLERGMYSGEVTASILVDDLRVGDTLEFAYSIEGQNPVFGGKFSDVVAWDQPVPTALRRVVLNYPTSRQIFWRRIGNWRSRAVKPAGSDSPRPPIALTPRGRHRPGRPRPAP